jgi:glycosyltransferase involved in cell wall biosynthesis
LRREAGSVPRVSIGMPVYNGGATIEEAVSSLLAQTFAEFELLISDNASRDETQSICEGFAAKDDRVRYVRHAENRGVMANFEFVLSGTTALYYMWAAADDIWAPEYLETVVRLLDEDPGAVIGFTFVQNFQMPDGDWIIDKITRFETPDRRERVRRYLLQSDGDGKANLIYGLLRRSAIGEAFETLRWAPFGSDMLFVFYLLLRGPFRIAPKILFYKRYQHVASGKWKAVAYVGENLRYALRYTKVARLAGASPVFRFYVLALVACKYVRDLFIWSGWMLKAVKRRFVRRSEPSMRIPLRRRMGYLYHSVRYRIDSVLYRLNMWNADGTVPHVVKRRVVRDYAKRYGATTLVETGTYMGDMVAAMSHSFRRIYTIELQPSFFAKARARFARKHHVTVLHGDSGREIARVSTWLDEPALFWLDAHYSGGTTARGDLDTPIVAELRHILGSGDIAHVLLIDDARSFTGRDGYPTIEELRELVNRLRPQYVMEVALDIIRITPPPVADAPI